MTFELRPEAMVYVPDGVDVEQALARTTHVGIGAHADDLEFMAWSPIMTCHDREDAWFTAIVVSDGRGSPREGAYAGFTDDQMREVRREEQRAAARLGRYSALFCLDFPSAVIRAPHDGSLRRELRHLVRACRAREVYTHTPTDRHDTHAALSMAVVDSLRGLPLDLQPDKMYGCEVWGALDWLVEADKVKFDVSGGLAMMAPLMGVFASQIAGGKRYDLATIGRKRANATYLRSHEVDRAAAMEYALDMSALLREPALSVADFVDGCLSRFSKEVSGRLRRFS